MDYEVEPGEGRMDELTQINHIKKQIDAAEKDFGTIYDRCKTDLEMANGTRGDQFSQSDKTNRGSERAEFSFPVLDKFVEYIVGNYNTSPFGIEYSPYDSNSSDKATVISAVVAGIESRSRAKSIYRRALRSLTTTGYGWIHATTEYDNPQDDSLDVSIKLEYIEDYSSVLIDPLSTEIDGSDAMWIAHVNTISLAEAKKLYGDDVDMYSDEGLFDSRIETDLSDDTSIKVVTHYEKICKKSTIYVDQLGNKSDEKLPGYLAKEKTKTHVKCTKTVGNKIVFESDLEQTCLPIVPTYGLPIYKDGKPQYVGIIHRAIDAQRLFNYSASSAAERLARSNKTEFIAPARAIQPHAEEWKNSSKSLYPVLPYSDVDENGNAIAAPIKVDTAINVNDVLPMSSAYLDTIGAIIGISPQALGGQSQVQETAEAVFTKARASETILSTLYENLASSIEQVGRVLLQMVSSTYDTPRVVPMGDQDGAVEMGEIPFPELNIMPTEFEVSVSSGPLLATQRKENAKSLMAVANMMGPNSQLILPEIIKSIDLGKEGKSVLQKAELIAQTSMQAIQSGPQNAQMQAQQMQQLTQQNQMLQQQVQQLNSQVIQNQMDLSKEEMKIKADILKTNINNEAKMDLQRMKTQGDALLNDQEAEHEAEKLIMEQQIDLMNEMAETQSEIDAQQQILNPGLNQGF